MNLLFHVISINYQPSSPVSALPLEMPGMCELPWFSHWQVWAEQCSLLWCYRAGRNQKCHKTVGRARECSFQCSLEWILGEFLWRGCGSKCLGQLLGFGKELLWKELLLSFQRYEAEYWMPDRSLFLQLPLPCQELPLPKVMHLRFLGSCRGSWFVFGFFLMAWWGFFVLLCVGFGVSGFFSCGNSLCMDIFWIKPASSGGIGWVFVVNKWKLLPLFCVQLFWTVLLSSWAALGAGQSKGMVLTRLGFPQKVDGASLSVRSTWRNFWPERAFKS